MLKIVARNDYVMQNYRNKGYGFETMNLIEQDNLTIIVLYLHIGMFN